MVIARKEAAKFPFNTPTNLCLANILDSALHVVSEGHLK